MGLKVKLFDLQSFNSKVIQEQVSTFCNENEVVDIKLNEMYIVVVYK